jgi:uncharacterized protein (DUF433 family)
VSSWCSIFWPPATPPQIRDQYDHLTADDIQACLAYAKEVIQSERVYAVKR